MLKIGITGGIGSGKTTVCKVFELLGIPVFYADQEAKSLMITDQLLIEGVKQAFGQESYLPEGALNNKYIADIVFNDEEQLARLNALVHPAVFRGFENWIALQSPALPYVLKETALLFESGSYKMCDKNILVMAPEQVRIERVMQRDRVTEEQVRARMSKQLSDEEKLPRVDFPVVNDGNSSIIDQVLTIHKQLSAEA